jgi:hypothetical protein
MTDVIEVTSFPVIELTEEKIGVVEVQVPGLRGKRGDDGVAVAYIHQQATPSAEWIINHNLGVKPHITLLSVGGAEIEGSIIHISVNQARALFAVTVTGSARCI